MPRRVLVFDVNETLLDLTALDPEFERAFGTASARVQWFQAMLSSAFLATITVLQRIAHMASALNEKKG